MRAFLPDYAMVGPANLDAALALLGDAPGEWRPFAGGTDLMVLLEAGKLAQKKFVSLWDLRELKGISESKDWLTLGALTTYSEMRNSAVINRLFPMLAQAARETGGVATQNRGTLGGNIANASPAADSPPALLVYDSEVELLSAKGARWVPYRDFHTGYKTTVMAADEIIARLRLPVRRGAARELYRKVGTRKAQAISKVNLAASVELEGGKVSRARFALASVAPMPLRCFKAEALVEGNRLTPETIHAVRAQLEAEISPISDIRSTEGYRKRVAGNLLEEFLKTL